MAVYDHVISPCCHAVTYDAECSNCDDIEEEVNVVCFYCRGTKVIPDYLECSNCRGVFHIDNAIWLEDYDE